MIDTHTAKKNTQTSHKSNKNNSALKNKNNSSLKKYIVAKEYDGIILEDYLKNIMQVSSRQRQKLFFSKGVYINGQSAHSKRKLNAGDMVAIRQFKDNTYGVTPEAGTVEVLYEDKDIIVLNKPAKILVHPAGQTTSGTLANYLANYFKEKRQVVTIRAIHRLDRDTTGCVLFAKSGPIQTKLEQLLAQGKIHREYTAIISGDARGLLKKYPAGTIDLPIGKDPFSPNRRRVCKSGQTAITHFNVLSASPDFSILALQLKTGRTHQIRVHLAYSGFPVVGDNMYSDHHHSSVMNKKIKRQALHAAALNFIHPITGKNIQVTAPYPADFPPVNQLQD